MTSIFEQAMGADFDRLHPLIQRRFSVGLESGLACVGRGTMDRIWRAGGWVSPFLRLGARRHILLPRTGRDVPFVIENVPYTDAHGRETVTFVRTFAFTGGLERFDATMVFSPERACIVDYLGTHQHIATDLHLSADRTGAMVIRSGTHRLQEAHLDVRIPNLIAGDAIVRESYDDESARFRIEVTVTNRHFGPLFGYEGHFTADFHKTTEGGPDGRPRRRAARTRTRPISIPSRSGRRSASRGC